MLTSMSNWTNKGEIVHEKGGALQLYWTYDGHSKESTQF